MNMFAHTEIPYGAYWSTPFVKWQGAFQHLNAFQFAAWVARRELDRRAADRGALEHLIFGSTLIQQHSFYGCPWVGGLVGLDAGTGPVIHQACATGTRLLASGLQEIESGLTETALLLGADRTSNGPHVYYPQPRAMGGTGASEDIVVDNFNHDPLGGHSMLDTAENVAAKHKISTSEQHEVVLRRLEQYAQAVAEEHAFQKRYMNLPFEVPSPDFRKADGTVQSDEGVFLSSAEGLAKLRPVKQGGTVTFGGQTHPADGNAGMIVTSTERVRDFSRDSSIRIQVLGFGQARVGLGFMPEAPVPAAHRALKNAGLREQALDAVKTHNPFAINDIVLSRALNFPLQKINNFGCSLIWGHPHAATALRSVIELIEELTLRGGGTGLFAGCAAGDSAMAVILKVSSR